VNLLKLSGILGMIAWIAFWVAGASFGVIVLGGAIYFAPWPFKVVAFMLLVSTACFGASTGVDFWRQRH